MSEPISPMSNRYPAEGPGNDAERILLKARFQGLLLREHRGHRACLLFYGTEHSFEEGIGMIRVVMA